MVDDRSVRRWFVENSLGLSPTFLERCLRGDRAHTKAQLVPTSECVSIVIEAMIPLSIQACASTQVHIRGYQLHSNTRLPIVISQSVCVRENMLLLTNLWMARVTVFSCHNEIALYIFLEAGGKMEIYHTRFFPCRLLRTNHVLVYEVALYGEQDIVSISTVPSYRLQIKAFSHRDLHYNWEDPVARQSTKSFVCQINNTHYIHRNMGCIFCFKECENSASLVHHINNIHIRHSASMIRDVEAQEHETVMQIAPGALVPALRRREHFFFCKKRRGHVTQHTFLYDYFEPEIFDRIGTKKSTNDWRSLLISKRFDEIIDLPNTQVQIIKDWTLFIEAKRPKPHSTNVVTYVTEFVRKREPSFGMFAFLTCLYNNAVLTLEEVRTIIAHRIL